jgi:hypothetical protein
MICGSFYFPQTCLTARQVARKKRPGEEEVKEIAQ